MEEKSLAWEIIKLEKKKYNRLFVLCIVMLFMWFATGVYLIYVLNDVGTIETTQEVSQTNNDGYNNYIGNDGEINNGNSKDKGND